MTGVEARKRAERRGRLSEVLAEGLLRLKGYSILARRLRTPVGEIDLVARRRRLIAFVEVKARRNEAQARESITDRQKARLQRAARAFCARRPEFEGFDMRFDAILIVPGAWPRHLQNIWDLG